MPDDELEAIEAANNIHPNVGTRGNRGAKLGSRKQLFGGRGSQLARLFSRAKAAETRRKNKKRLLTSTNGTTP